MISCPSCGRENPDDARFCSSCGTPVGHAEGTAPRRERKFATALFADLVGSTSFAEREDPEIVQVIVGRAFDRLAVEIERYGGLLEKFMGDAILAVFGVPTAHEDDPERSVRCALEMHAVLSEINRGFAAEGRPVLAMRIGVEAGEVLVDLDRVAGPRDRMLTGDAVNTAARLQAAAPPGQIVVGPAVYASTKAVIDYDELPPLELKGKAELVPAWRALRVRARRRGERAPLGLEARMIGRDEELVMLKQTLHRVEQESRPALVTVLGPAGVGKSRITWELLKYVEGLPQVVYWRKGRCLAYGNVSYSALAEAVKAQCEILEDDPPEVAAEKVEAAVEELFGDREVVPHIRALVGGGEERAFGREELFDAWRRFLERMAARYPLALVLEDLHWADGGLLDFVDHLADWAQGPIYVLTLARPELLDLRPGWGGGKRNYSAIYLDPLSPDENEAMLGDLLSGALPEQLTRLVVERSEGNPLFTEEIVRMLIDRGILRATEARRWELARPIDEVDIPRSIQGLIAARLDSLPSDEKAALQDAAVVGRVFWLGTVSRLSGVPSARMREVLGRLRVKEVLVPREPPTFSGEPEFAFRHALIRDVAYESLPKAERAAKHVQAARWAEERAGERAEELAETIATHHSAALAFADELGAPGDPGLVADVVAWSRRAGARARRLWQGDQAVRWTRRAVELAERETWDDETLCDLYREHADAAFGVVSLDEGRLIFARWVELAARLGRDREAGRAETLFGFLAFQSGDDPLALERLSRARARLEPLGDTAELALVYDRLGGISWRRGHLDEAEPLLRRGVEIARNAGDDEALAHATQTLALSLRQPARWREARDLLDEALRIARGVSDVTLLLRTINNVASAILFLEPDPERGEALAREGLEIARRSGQRIFEGWLSGTLGEYAMDAGRLAEADDLLSQSLEIQREIADLSAQSLQLGFLSYCRTVRGRRDEALTLLAEATEFLRPNPESQMGSIEGLVRGLLAEADGDDEAAAARYLEGHVDDTAPGRELVAIGAVRALVRVGRRQEAERLRRWLHDAALGRRHAVAYAIWADAVLSEDPDEAVALLRDAAARLGAIGKAVERVRVLIDLADAESRAGVDPEATIAEARRVLGQTGAELFAPVLDRVVAALAP